MERKTVTFKTLGCKVNQYETQAMREQFLKAGFRQVEGCAEVYVINTCTVTQKADSESRRLIRNAIKENPGSKVIITGCYVELDEDKNKVKKITDNLLLVANSEKSKIFQYLDPGINNIDISGAISSFENRTKAFVKVQDGCDNFCSYCKVPLVRGRSRSRISSEIISEITGLVSRGYKEIVLTGICLGDWGRELGLDLNRFLSEIKKIEGSFRVRLSSIEPWYVSQDLMRRIADSRRFCRHLHIPIQSGDDEILKLMNRHFKADDFFSLISRLRLLIPEVAFTTDVLVGFPGESEEQFRNTLRIIELTRPFRIHIFPFSRREGTAAASFKNTIPDSVIKERISRLRSLRDRLAIEYIKQFIGKSAEILVENKRDKQTGLLVGYTDTYIKIAFQGPDELKGRLVNLDLSTAVFMQLNEGESDSRGVPLTNTDSYAILAPHFERKYKTWQSFSIRSIG